MLSLGINKKGPAHDASRCEACRVVGDCTKSARDLLDESFDPDDDSLDSDDESLDSDDESLDSDSRDEGAKIP